MRSDRARLQDILDAIAVIEQQVRELNPQVPWKSIAKMRNIIAHVYFGIDWGEVWQVARADIHALKPQILSILATLAQDS